MSWIEALLLGVLQGLAEYLPISSSGHLEIFKDILGLDLEAGESLQFDVMLHVATVLSTIVVLWSEFVPLCRSFFTFKKDENTSYVLKLLLSAVPIGIVGVCFKDQIEALFEGDLTIVGVCLIATAALLAFSYFYRTGPALAAKGEGATLATLKADSGRDITWLDALVIGLAQAVAVLPGLSRSGTTIATGVIIGDKREQVARFSFFMVIIPILGEALLDIKKLLEGEGGGGSIGLLPMAIGFIAAFVVGCAACKWMLELVKKGKLVWFAAYCLAVGLLCIIF